MCFLAQRWGNLSIAQDQPIAKQNHPINYQFHNSPTFFSSWNYFTKIYLVKWSLHWIFHLPECIQNKLPSLCNIFSQMMNSWMWGQVTTELHQQNPNQDTPSFLYCWWCIYRHEGRINVTSSTNKNLKTSNDPSIPEIQIIFHLFLY